MRFFSSLVRPDESTGAVMRWVHRIWVFFWLTVLGAGIGLLSLYLTAHSYASIDATALLQSYFKIPLLVAMNLLAPILLVYLGFFLFARPWAAYLLSALPFFTLALASYYKVQLRGDPVLATDLRLIRTAGGIMGNYTFEISAPVIVVLEGFVLMLVLFGDHKPWMGNGSSVYAEMGVDLDVSTQEGFYNYFSTPYLIYANKAAKESLGQDFRGDGGDISPCFLMDKLFFECGWTGDGFMQLQRETRAVTPLMHEDGYRMVDGSITLDVPPDVAEICRRYLCAQYYREQHFISES